MLNMFTTPLPGSPKQKGMDLSDLEAMLAQCDDEGIRAAFSVTHTCPASKHELCQQLIRQYGGVDGAPAVAEDVVKDVVNNGLSLMNLRFYDRSEGLFRRLLVGFNVRKVKKITHVI